MVAVWMGLRFVWRFGVFSVIVGVREFFEVLILM